jgi:hypothetical protein
MSLRKRGRESKWKKLLIVSILMPWMDTAHGKSWLEKIFVFIGRFKYLFRLKNECRDDVPAPAHGFRYSI